jgi:biotin operon repressor
MTNKNKAAPTIGVVETAASSNHKSDQVETSRVSILSQVGAQGKKILLCLNYGEENAVSLRDLIALTNIPDRRLRHEIELMRRAGAPILSGEHGYWLVNLSGHTGQQEAARYLRQENSRARAIYARLAPLRRQVDAVQAQAAGDQMTFDEVV